jgi:alkyl sulfatase BDS1-like metallo-beta-lactamase superfamily hydrolase
MRIAQLIMLIFLVLNTMGTLGAVAQVAPKPATEATKRANADAELTLPKDTLDQIQLKQTTIDQEISSGDLKIQGRAEAFTEFLGLLDSYPFWFNIVTP